jgi:hypothetical protein
VAAVSSRAERLAFLLTIPWVSTLTEPYPTCQGLIHSRIALKHHYSMGGRPPEGIPDKARCKFRARYHYVAGTGPDDHAETGDYCWHHVIKALRSDDQRYQQWEASS